MPVANPVPDEAQEAFDRIDADGDGYITFREFAALMLEMDHTRSEFELRAIFDTLDTDRDGRVNLAKFRAWMSR